MEKDKHIVQEFSCDCNYLSDVSPVDKPWDKHKKFNDKVAALYKQMDDNKRVYRLNKCSHLLEFAFRDDSESKSNFKLTFTEFCRLRTCPICQWRRVLVWRFRIYQALPKIFDKHQNYELIFLTLTIKNCPINELKSAINNLNKAWIKLSKRKVFPGIGWVKSVEVTKPADNNKMAHPHLHCIIMVSPKYFKTNQYLSHQKWLELWQKSLKVDYEPSIKVKKVGLKPYKLQKLIKKLNRQPTKLEKISYALLEVFKYSIKEQDLVSDVSWLQEVTKQIHNTRAISLSGIFKEYMKEDDPEDLINLENQEVEIVREEAKFLFEWIEEVNKYRSY